MGLFGSRDIETLKAKGDIKGLVRALRRKYKDNECYEIANKAFTALKEIGAPAIPYLKKALQDKAHHIRYDAVDILGAIQSERVIQLLLDALKDESATIRQNAAGHLASRKGKKVVEELIRCLSDKESNVRYEAATSLGRIQDKAATEPLIEALKDCEEKVRLAVIEALGEIGDVRAVGSLINATKDGDDETRERVAKTLAGFDDPTVGESLVELLQDSNPRVVRAAAEAIGNVKEARAVGPLVKVMKAGEYYSKRAAATALENIGWKPEDFRQKILYFAAKDELEEIAKQGQANLGCLIQAAREGDKEVRILAIQTLGKIRDEGVVDPLILALRDDDTDVKCTAASALGDLKIGRSVGPLIGLLDDEDDKMRAAAAAALGEIKDPRAVSPLVRALERWHCQSAMSDALSEIGEAAIEALSAALQSENRNLQKEAIYILGKTRSAKAVLPLKKVLQGTDADLQEESEKALGKIATPESKEALREYFKAQAHQLAQKWWTQTKRKDAVCDRCNALLNKNEGYAVEPALVGVSVLGMVEDLSGVPDLICNSYMNKDPDAKPFPESKFNTYLRKMSRSH